MACLEEMSFWSMSNPFVTHYHVRAYYRESCMKETHSLGDRRESLEQYYKRQGKNDSDIGLKIPAHKRVDTMFPSGGSLNSVLVPT